MSLRCQYLYSKDLACISKTWPVILEVNLFFVAVVPTSIMNQKPCVTTLTEETENIRFKTWQSKISNFRISNICIDFLTDFTKGVPDFRVVGDPSDKIIVCF